MQKNSLGSPAPWWKFGYVWFVFGGPAVVVVASFVTFYLAVTRPDEIVTEDYYRKGIEINNTLGADAHVNAAASLAPALQARNHAQTGVVAKPQVSLKP
jgi:hypothetical protein